jgi:broad specificity phosphatase PhoE
MSVTYHLITTGSHTWTKSQKLVGIRDISLDQNGRKQALAAAKYLQNFQLTEIHYARTTRAAQTYKIIFAQLFPQQHRQIQTQVRQSRGTYYSLRKRNSSITIPTRRDARLNDINYGSLQGLFPEEREARFATIWHQFQKDPQHTTFPSGESFDAVCARVHSYLRQFTVPNLFETHYAVITHTTIARIIEMIARKEPLAYFFHKTYTDGDIIVVECS